ncbi:MAG TPA: dienelactone hydrolase family protein [Oculatellaceae cyanobacterium]
MYKLSKKWKGAEHVVKVDAGSAILEGGLCIPEGATGIVVFVHGSGSGRLSPRNQFVSTVLNTSGLATLLFDLLTPREEKFDAVTGQLRFDIDFLADRVVRTTKWLKQSQETTNLATGYFGASTGAAAALTAASELPSFVKAVVSRGGRPDLAGSALPRVKAPTLLIVGGNDSTVINLNKLAIQQLPVNLEKSMEIVPGATHLFEEPGTLERVADLSCKWFLAHLKN